VTRWMLSRLVTFRLASRPVPSLRRLVTRPPVRMASNDAPPPKEVTANIEGEGGAQTKSAGKYSVIYVRRVNVRLKCL
jgi:hypothetical protein